MPPLIRRVALSPRLMPRWPACKARRRRYAGNLPGQRPAGRSSRHGGQLHHLALQGTLERQPCVTKTSASASAAIGKLTGAVTSTTTRIDNSLESLQPTIDHNKAVIGHLEILANDTSTGSKEIDARIVSTIDLLREQNEKLQSIKDGLSAQSNVMANDAAAVPGALTLSITQFIPVRPTLAKPRRTWAKTRCRRPRARSILLLPFRAI